MVGGPSGRQRGDQLRDADGALEPPDRAVRLGDEPQIGAEGVSGADGGRGGLEEVEPEGELGRGFFGGGEGGGDEEV